MDTYVNSKEIQEKNQNSMAYGHTNGREVKSKTGPTYFNFLPYGITLVIGIFGHSMYFDVNYD